jgi:LPXTG-motif cell wall-anchored protein
LAGGVVRNVLVVVAVAAAAAFLAPLAGAEQPFRLQSQIEDRVGALEGREDEVQDELQELEDEEQIQLWLAYVDSFSGVGAQEWANETAEQSDLGLSDVLLAVATGDRAYAYSVDEQFPLSDDELADIAGESIEPELSDEDWAGAAITAANELQAAAGGDTTTGGDGDGGGSSGWLWLVLGGLALLGLVWWLFRRRSRDRAPATLAPEETDEFAALSTDELSKRASSLLVQMDDAIKTSEQEVAFAAAQFGDETAAPFAAAVESAKADVARAFELRRALDDSTEEDDARQRAMLKEIITLTQGASDRLDAEVERFDELRAMERNAPELLAALESRLGPLEGRVPHGETALATLTETYAPEAVASVSDNIRQAGERITFARGEVAEGRREVEAGSRGKAAVAIRGAEEAVGQAGQLFDAIDRLATDLADADDKIRAAIPEVVSDLTAARAVADGKPELAKYVTRAEHALAAAERAASITDGQDPLGALHRLEEAGKALDTALVEAREEQEQARRARAALEQTLSGARAKIEAADDFITTRRGAVGADARTRLAEAKRHYEQSLATAADDALAGLEHARTADGLAEQALRIAQQDVAGYGSGPTTRLPGMPGGGGGGLGDLLIGGILIDLLLGGRGGGGGGGRGGGGGWSIPGGLGPGSFGGMGTRGRRGGGGRF